MLRMLGACIKTAICGTITVMIKLRDNGSINILLIPFILIILFFIGAVAFGFWAFGSRQDFKNNSDQKSAAASAIAVKAEDAKKDAQFLQDDKKPFKTYQGPATYGGVQLSYPKTWSGYVNDTNNGVTAIDAYFSPGVVPSLAAPASVYALRVQVLSQSYSATLQTFANLVTAKKVTVTPYSLPQVPGQIGERIDGGILTDKQGSMVILPMRDKTLKIWTEGTQYRPDFDTNILPNFTFSP